MSETKGDKSRLAVLIDADNIGPSSAADIFRIVSKPQISNLSGKNAADLRNERIKVKTLALCCQRVFSLGKSGEVIVAKAGSLS